MIIKKYDRPLRADIKESLRRGGEIIFDSENVIMVRDKNSGGYFLDGTDVEIMKELCKQMKPSRFGDTLVIIRNREIQEFLVKEMNFKTSEWCYLVEYEKETPIEGYGHVNIHRPSPSDYAKFKATYGMLSEEKIKDIFESPSFVGAYDEDGEMMGYIGQHPEGAYGPIHVFEKYRGRGIGKELQVYAINQKLAEGCNLFGYIVEDNNVSIDLSKKLGMSFAEGKLCWVWKEN